MNTISAVDVYNCIKEFYSSETELLSTLFAGEFFYSGSKKKTVLVCLGDEVKKARIFDFATGNMKSKWRQGIISSPDTFWKNIKDVVRKIGHTRIAKLLQALQKLVAQSDSSFYMPKSCTTEEICAHLLFELFMTSIGGPSDYIIPEGNLAKDSNAIAGIVNLDVEEINIYGNSPIDKTCNLEQTIYENSREAYLRLAGQYIINKDLCPSLTSALSQCTQVIGDGGSGKTTFLLAQWESSLKIYEEDRKNNLIPVYIPLNLYNGIVISGKDFIKEYIAKFYANVAADEFAWEPTRYMFLLDGANESPLASQLGKEIQQLVDFDCSIYITSRYKLEWQSLKRFTCVKLNELSDETIKSALSTKGLPMAEGRLLQALRRPMWLALYLGIKDIKGINTPGEILREHHKWLLSKVSDDLQGEEYTKKYRVTLEYMPRLAVLTKTIVFNQNDIVDGMKPFFPEFISVDDFLSIGISTGLLKCLGTDLYKGKIIYRWSHEHYLDFYRAAYVWNDIEKCRSNLPQSVSEELLPITVLTFLGDLLGEYKQNAVELCLKRFATGRRGTAVQLVCRNLIDTMKIARDCHLENFCFNNLDLSRVNFEGCWISGSSFVRAKFSPAFMNEQSISFLDEMCYLPRHDLLITSNKENSYISLWNYSDAQYVGSVALGKGIVSLDVSPDEKLLATVYWHDNITISVYSIDELLEYVKASDYTKIPRSLVIQVYEANESDDEEEAEVSFGPPRFVAFNSDSNMILCVHGCGEIVRWDVKSKKKLPSTYCLEWDEDYVPTCFALSPSRSSLAICARKDDKNILVIYDIENDEYEIIRDNNSGIDSITYTPDERRVICHSYKYDTNNDESLGCCLITQENPFAVCKDTTTNYKQVKLVATENYIFYSRGCNGDLIEKFALNTLEKIEDLDIPCHGVVSLETTELVVFPQRASSCGSLLVLETEFNKELRAFGARPAKSTKFALSFDERESKILRISENGYVDRYDWQNKTLQRDENFSQLLGQCPGKPTFTRIVGNYYFSVVDNRVMNIWNIHARELVQTFTGDFHGIKRIGLSENAYYLIATKYGSHDVLIGNIKTGHLQILSGNSTENSWYVDIPSAKVICGTCDGYIKTWDLTDGTLVCDKKLDDDPIVAVAAIPNSSLIIFASKYGVLQVYDSKERTFHFRWCEEDESTLDNTVRIIPISMERSIIQSKRWGGALPYLFDHINGIDMGVYIPDPAIEVDYEYIVSDDKSTFAVYDNSGILHVYDTLSGEILVEEKLPLDWWKSAGLSSDGSTIFIANNSGHVLGWDVATGKRIISWNYSSCEDLYGSDFDKSIGLCEFAKQLLRENGATT